MRYRLTGELPKSERALADILRVEQSHSSIDIYETFVAVVQEIARHEQQTVAVQWQQNVSVTSQL